MRLAYWLEIINPWIYVGFIKEMFVSSYTIKFLVKKKRGGPFQSIDQEVASFSFFPHSLLISFIILGAVDISRSERKDVGVE